MLQREWRRLYKTFTSVKEQVQKKFPYRRSHAEHQLFEETKSGKLLNYVQGDIKIAEKLKLHLANPCPILKNTLADRKTLDSWWSSMQKNNVWQLLLRECFIAASRVERSLPLFCCSIWSWALCTTVHRFVEYTPRKCFSNFAQSTVDAQRESEENPNSTVVMRPWNCYLSTPTVTKCSIAVNTQ